MRLPRHFDSMTDFLILYEHKNREIENCVLLQLELERRGYNVRIENIITPSIRYIRPKVVIAPHFYNDDQVVMFGDNYWHSNKALLSMQYEQVLARGEYANPNDLHYPKGQAKKAHHIAWGNAQTKRYIECGIDKENVHETGFISMDLFREEFRSYFKTRKEIASEFSLDIDKEWILFVSSFSYVNRSEDDMKILRGLNVWADLKAKIANESFNTVLDWFSKAAELYPNKLFIYRPHPAEKDNPKIKEVEGRIPNFRCIDEGSMRQWALVIDRAYNWYSTSAADLFFAHKPTKLLRPVPIPEEIDMELFDNFERITDYERFIDSIENTEDETTLDSRLLESYYGDGKGRMAFQKVADVCEKLAKDEQLWYNYDYEVISEKERGVKRKIWNMLRIPLYYMCCTFKVGEWKIFPEHIQRTMRLYKNDIYGVNHEIESLRKRFKPILDIIK